MKNRKINDSNSEPANFLALSREILVQVISLPNLQQDLPEQWEQAVQQLVKISNTLLAEHAQAMLETGNGHNQSVPYPLEIITQEPFSIEATSWRFAHWLAHKTLEVCSVSRRFPTQKGFYVLKLRQQATENRAIQNPPMTFRLNGIHCSNYELDKEETGWTYDDPQWYAPEATLIQLVLVPLDDSRIEVHADCFSAAMASYFKDELLATIGKRYPESELPSSQVNRGGRPKIEQHTSEQRQLIKRIAALRIQGYSVGQIATQVGRSPSRIAQICRENNLKKGM